MMLTFKDQIAKTKSRRFALHNIRKLRPFLTQGPLRMKHSFSSRPMSFLGWTIVMLFWLDFHHVQSNLYK